MRKVLAIVADWFLRIRAQASFRIMLVLVLLIVAVVFLLRFGDDAVEIAWVFRIPLGGLWDLLEIPNPGLDASRLLFAMLIGFLTDVLPGVAFLVALFATGGVIPDLMRRGRIDLLLARPVTRTQVVLGNFLGGLLFVGLLGGLLVGGSWLALAARGELVSPIYLASLPVMLVQYALVYAVATLLGFLLRSGTAVVLLTLGIWTCGKVFAVFHVMRGRALEKSAAKGLDAVLAGPMGLVLDAIYWILPAPATWTASPRPSPGGSSGRSSGRCSGATRRRRGSTPSRSGTGSPSSRAVSASSPAAS